MENAMMEFAIEGRGYSAAMESLKRARQKAGITAADIKPANRRAAKKTEPATDKSTKPTSWKKVASDIRITMARTDANIKEHTKRKKEIEAEIEKLSRLIGPGSMTVSIKRQELRKEEEKISKLEGVYERLRKLLLGGR